MGAGRALGSAGALARNGRSADGGRMSTPPPIAPVSTPTPEPRRPWWRRRVVPIAVAGVVRISAAVAHANAGSSGACLVNGNGNKLCGADAIAYCQLLADQGAIPVTPLS